MSLVKMEHEAKGLIRRGETTLAVQLAHELSIAWARKKNFKKATAWREQLIALNPMATVEILETGEVIDAEKSSTIDFWHQKVWEKFYYSLSQEEAIGFYLHLMRREVPAGQTIFQQGSLNDKLFLVDNGKVKIVFNIGGQEVFIHEFEQGGSFGEDTFFNLTNCSSTAVVTSPSVIRYIDRSALRDMERAFPGISHKLKLFCGKEWANNSGEIFNPNIDNRRIYPRYKLKGKVLAQIFNHERKPMGPVASGNLDDISVGGAAFSIRSSNANIGDRLRGRSTVFALQLENGPKIKLNGRILGARYDNIGAYMTHLQFPKPFIPEEKDLISTEI